MFISVPATSANLGPGFDSLGLAISLRNEIIIKPSRFLSVSTKGEGADNPHIRKNLLFMNIFNKQYEILKGRRDNFRFEFNNKIPISRGLGSSSAVIVAALASAFVVAKERYSKRKILNLALEYEPHPDNITPAVMGGFNVSCVEDDKVYSKKRKMPDYLKAGLVYQIRQYLQQNLEQFFQTHIKKRRVATPYFHSYFYCVNLWKESWGTY